MAWDMGIFSWKAGAVFRIVPWARGSEKQPAAAVSPGQQLNGPALFFTVIIRIPVWGEEQQKQDAVIFSLFLSLDGGSAVFSQGNQCVIIALFRRRNHTDICGDTRKGGFVQYRFKPAEEGLNVVSSRRRSCMG